ncbi:MAG: DUF1987 domain-containing protein [Bacteroidales bacterium]|nr:DUF1987 domain-containing protein [Bacteroidales bacterium]
MKNTIHKFKCKTGKGNFEGRSITENSIEFYRPVINWIQNNLINKKSIDKFFVDFQLEYFNTSSSKCILSILTNLENAYELGVDIKINWFYEKDDEDILEAGEYFDRLVNLPIKLIEL